MRHALDIDTMTPSEHHQNQMLKTAYEANYSLTGDGLDGWRDGLELREQMGSLKLTV